MRDHLLPQAIARVNWLYEDDEGQVEPYGFILDFVGIFEKLERALTFDSEVVGSVIQNIDALKQLFATWMQDLAQWYLPFARGWYDKAKEQGGRISKIKSGSRSSSRFSGGWRTSTKCSPRCFPASLP